MTEQKRICPVDMTISIEDLDDLPAKVAEYEHRTHEEATHLIIGYVKKYAGVGKVYGLTVIQAGVTEPILTNDPDYWVSHGNNEGTKR